MLSFYRVYSLTWRSSCFGQSRVGDNWVLRSQGGAAATLLGSQPVSATDGVRDRGDPGQRQQAHFSVLGPSSSQYPGGVHRLARAEHYRRPRPPPFHLFAGSARGVFGARLCRGTATAWISGAAPAQPVRHSPPAQSCRAVRWPKCDVVLSAVCTFWLELEKRKPCQEPRKAAMLRCS